MFKVSQIGNVTVTKYTERFEPTTTTGYGFQVVKTYTSFDKEAINHYEEKAEELEEPKCKTCKYYTGKTGNRMSKTKKYCNRTATIKMYPDDFCSRWDKREVMANEDSN